MKISFATFAISTTALLFGLLPTATNATDVPSFGIDMFKDFGIKQLVDLFRPAIKKPCPEDSFIILKFQHKILQSELNFVEWTATAISSTEPFEFGDINLNLVVADSQSVIFQDLQNGGIDILADLSNIVEISFHGLDLTILNFENLQDILKIRCCHVIKVRFVDCIIESISFLKSFKKLKTVSFIASSIMHFLDTQNLEFPLINELVWNSCGFINAAMPIASVRWFWEIKVIKQMLTNIISEELVLKISQLFPSLATLMLTIRDGSLRNLLVLSKLPTLKVLCLFSQPDRDMITIQNLDLFILALPNLEELYLQSMHIVDFTETLDLSVDVISPDHPFKHLYILGLHHVQEIPESATGTQISNAKSLFEFEKKFKNLEKIHLDGCIVRFGHTFITQQSVLNDLMPSLTRISLNENKK